jgi:hypothetical protein
MAVKKPTFDELTEESRYAGPRRTPVLDHAAVTKAVIEWFQNKSQWRAAETEMALPTSPRRKATPKSAPSTIVRRADVIAFNSADHEFYIIEVKAQWNDFHQDRKFFDYRKWCNWFAFAVPEELAVCARRRMDDIPGWYEGVGLLVIPNDYSDRRMVRRPKKYEMSDEDYRSMAERWGLSCWGRLIGTRTKIAELEWQLKNIRSDVRQLQKKLGDSNPTLYP